MNLSKRGRSVCKVKKLGRKEPRAEMWRWDEPVQFENNRLRAGAAVFVRQGWVCTPCERGGIQTTGREETLEPGHALVGARGGMFSYRNVLFRIR